MNRIFFHRKWKISSFFYSIFHQQHIYISRTFSFLAKTKKKRSFLICKNKKRKKKCDIRARVLRFCQFFFARLLQICRFFVYNKSYKLYIFISSSFMIKLWIRLKSPNKCTILVWKIQSGLRNYNSQSVSAEFIVVIWAMYLVFVMSLLFF